MSRSFMQGFADELQKVGASEPTQTHQPQFTIRPPMETTPGVTGWGKPGSPGASGAYKRPAFQPPNSPGAMLRAMKPNLLPGNPYEGLTKEQMQQPKLTFPKTEAEHIQSGQATAKRLAAESAAAGRLLPGPAKTTGHASSKTHAGTAKKVVAKSDGKNKPSTTPEVSASAPTTNPTETSAEKDSYWDRKLRTSFVGRGGQKAKMYAEPMQDQPGEFGTEDDALRSTMRGLPKALPESPWGRKAQLAQPPKTPIPPPPAAPAPSEPTMSSTALSQFMSGGGQKE